ncbi:MAG: YolD-like family protein [Eubacterium coprostanoligenes]|nr:YolD-like family protein [Eubacterium coprostanoligenes]
MKYDDIISLPHYTSTKRAHLSTAQRSAQFASFAALKGFEDEIAETARVTEERAILDENEIEALNDALQYISYNLNEIAEVSITYFVPDKLKSGGAYVTKVGSVKKIDSFARRILIDDTEIPIDDIVKIEI